jgi:uncharacterized protein
MKTTILINEFLMQRRFAMVGVSRNSNDFSCKLFKDFIHRGYDVIPVNPNVNQIEGRYCFRNVQEIKPQVTAALLMTSRAVTDQVVRECILSGMTLIWMYGISGAKNVSQSALQSCEENRIRVIPGYCPYMFMPKTAVFHRFHGFIWRALGKYPQ